MQHNHSCETSLNRAIMKSSWWSYAMALRAQNVTCSQPARGTRGSRLVDIKACPLVCVACDISQYGPKKIWLLFITPYIYVNMHCINPRCLLLSAETGSFSHPLHLSLVSWGFALLCHDSKTWTVGSVQWLHPARANLGIKFSRLWSFVPKALYWPARSVWDMEGGCSWTNFFAWWAGCPMVVSWNRCAAGCTWKWWEKGQHRECHHHMESPELCAASHQANHLLNASDVTSSPVRASSASAHQWAMLSSKKPPSLVETNLKNLPQILRNKISLGKSTAVLLHPLGYCSDIPYIRCAW